MFDACVVGHVTKDIIRVRGKAVREMPGGTAYYTCMALRSLGLNVAVITKVAAEDQDNLLGELKRCGIAVFCQQSDRTTTFENTYQGVSPDHRIQRVMSIAPSFSPPDLADIRATILHVGPLTKGDVSAKFLEEASHRADLVSLDVQGLVRVVQDGEVQPADWPEKEEGLSHIDILKASEGEATMLTGVHNVERAACRLSSFGPKEVMVTSGRMGSLIFSNGGTQRIPAFPPRALVDPTGCGDTYVAGYICQRLRSADPGRAGRFAAAAATLKLENFGPFRGSEADVRIVMS